MQDDDGQLAVINRGERIKSIEYGVRSSRGSIRNGRLGHFATSNWPVTRDGFFFPFPLFHITFP